MEQFKLYDRIICIDLKSFFASVECVKINKDPFKYDLVVADTSRGGSSIILAVSPSLKNKGVPGRLRLNQLPKGYKIHIAKPKMADYIETSNNILKMYLHYFAPEDILSYSIDEVFIDVSSYTQLYKLSTYKLAEFLLKKLKSEFGLSATCGIGYNMLLAKFALDIEAKNNNSNIAVWTYSDLPEKLWPISKLTNIWGIGKGLDKRLKAMNINTMYDLAHCDIYKLVKEFGVLGEELYLHAHGIDISKIQDQHKITHERKGYNVSHTLYKNTPKDQARQLVKELVLSQAQRLRSDNKATCLVSLYVGYSAGEQQPSFRMQKKLASPTIELKELTKIILDIYDENVLDINIRRIGLSFSKLSHFDGMQLNLFQKPSQLNTIELDFAYDKVNSKFGKNTVFKASALSSESKYFSRSKLIGGHNAE